MDVIHHHDEVMQESEGGTTRVLVSRWRAGDPEAFGEVVERYQGPLLAYVLAMLHHLQDAEDVVQETLMRAHASVHQLREPGSLTGWLKRIARNAALDAAKKSGRQGTPTDPSLMGEIGDAFGGEDRNAEEAGVTLETIVRAIQTLPETYREAAVYHYLQEWPSAKIAETLGIDAAAARQRISRAGKMLREGLGKSRDAEHHDL